MAESDDVETPKGLTMRDRRADGELFGTSRRGADAAAAGRIRRRTSLRALAAALTLAAVLFGLLWTTAPTEASSHLRWAGRTDETTKTFAQGGGGGQQWIASAEGGTGNISYKMHLKSDPTQGLPEGFGFGSGSARTRLQWSSSALDNYMAKTAYIWTATDSADPPASITLEFTIEITATTPTKPYAGGQGLNGRIILGWTGGEHLESWEYRLSPNSNFSGANWTAVPNSNADTASVTISSGLTDNQQYYAEVRGVNGPGGNVKGVVSNTVIVRNIVAASTIDYDTDDDGLIEVDNTAQLNAIRYDLDGNGLSTWTDLYIQRPNPPNAGEWVPGAFPWAALNMGCPDSGCIGYELTADLNLLPKSNEAPVHNDGEVNGWRGLGTRDVPFTATFEGNGKTIDNLIRGRFYPTNGGPRDSVSNNATNIPAGLFGIVGETGVIRNVNLTNVNVVGRTISTDRDVTKWSGQPIGALVAENRGLVQNSTASGRVFRMDAFNLHLKSTYHNTHTNNNTFWPQFNAHQTNASMGGLVGYNRGKIIGSGANVDVRGPGIIGGLAGVNHKVSGGEDGRDNGQIVNSYARGYVEVDGTSMGGGLVGLNNWGNISGSYASGDVYTKSVAAAGENVAVGGLAGVIHGRGTLISKSYATGDVTNRSSNDTSITHYRHLCYAGGLVGHAYHTDFQSDRKGNLMRIEDSYSTGNVANFYKNATAPQGACGVGVMVGFVNSGTRLELDDSYGVGVVRDQTTAPPNQGLPGYTYGIVGMIGQGPGYLTGSHSGAHPEINVNNSYYEIQRTTLGNRDYGSHKNDSDMRLATADDRRGVYSGWSTDVWDFRDDDGHTYPEIKVDWNGDGVATSAEFAAAGDDLGAQPHSYLWLTASEARHDSRPSIDLSWTRGDDNQGGFKWQWAYSTDPNSTGSFVAFLNQDDQGIGRSSIRTRFREMDNGETWFVRVRAVDQDGDQVGLISNQVHITFADSAPSFENTTIPDQVFVQGQKIDDLVLPTPTGGNAPFRYLLTPDSDGNPVLPGGLNWDAQTRTISGTPAAPFNETEFTWRVTDGDTINAESDELKFTIEVKSALGFGDASIDAQTLFLNTPVDLQFPAASGGIGPITHSLTNIPPGLTFDAKDRKLSGAPTQIWSQQLATYKATTGGDYPESTDITFNIEVKGCTFGTQTIDDLVYTVGEKIERHDLAMPEGTCSLAEDSGVTRDLFKESNPNDRSLPRGISIGHNVTSGEQFLQGTPIDPSTSVTYVYRANPSSRDGYPTLKFRIYSKFTLGELPAELYDPNKPTTPYVYIVDTSADAQDKLWNLPASSGGVGTDRAYSITPDLPTGVSFDANSRKLTIDKDDAVTAAPARTYTYTATEMIDGEPGDSVSKTFRLEVTKTTFPFISDQYVVIGTEADIQLPEATGGTGQYTYTLVPGTGSSGGPLPDGITFNEVATGELGARTINGTYDEDYGPVTLKYTATDENGVSHEQEFDFQVGVVRIVDFVPAIRPSSIPGPFETAFQPGVNAGGWVDGPVDVVELFRAVPEISRIWYWNAEQGRYQLAAQINSEEESDNPVLTGDLQRLEPGMGLLIIVDGEQVATWNRPRTTNDTTVLLLRDGWNLVSWTSHTGDALEHALEQLGDAIASVLAWDEDLGAYRSCEPGVDCDQLADLPALGRGGGFWLEMSLGGQRDWAFWRQRGERPAMSFNWRVSDGERQQVTAEVETVVDLFAHQSGVSPSDLTVQYPAETCGLDRRAKTIGLNADCLDMFASYYSQALQQYLATQQSSGQWGRATRSSPEWLAQGVVGYHQAFFDDFIGAGELDSYRRAAEQGADADGRALRLLESGLDADDASSQALAQLAVLYLVERAGPDALLDFYEQRRLSGAWQRAFRSAFGLSAAEFYHEFAAYRALVGAGGGVGG